MLQRTSECKYLFEILISIILGKYLGVVLPDHTVFLFLIFWGISTLHHFTFPWKVSSSLHPCLHLFIFVIVFSSHPKRCKMVFYYVFQPVHFCSGKLLFSLFACCSLLWKQWCYALNVSFQESNLESLMPRMLQLGSGDFQRWLYLNEGALMNEMQCFYRRGLQENPQPLPACDDRARSW